MSLIDEQEARMFGVKFTVDKEEMREVLNKIKYQDNLIKWTWTKDGWHYSMLTTTKKGIIYDVCVNCNDSEEAIVYVYKNRNVISTNIACNLVNQFMKEQIRG